MMKKLIGNNKGSALLMAVVAIVFLLILGLAVTTLSLGTLITNVADATTNDAYYAAEAGVSSALEHVKHEVSNYYATMIDAVGSSGYGALYDNFFANILINAQAYFGEPVFSGGISTHTTFGLNGSDNAQKTFTVTSTSTTADGTQYVVRGNVDIVRLDVRPPSINFSLPENHVIYSGGAYNAPGAWGGLRLSGNITVGDISQDPSYYTYYHSNGTFRVRPSGEPNALEDIFDYTVTYHSPSYTQPDVTVSNNGSYSAPKDAIRIIYGNNYSIGGDNLGGGLIHSTGNLTIGGGGGGHRNVDIYCEGNLTIGGDGVRGTASKRIRIYCKGNVTLANSVKKADIFCLGNVTIQSGNNGDADDKLNIYCNGNAYLTGGNNCVNVYARGTITAGNVGTPNVFLYSYSNVVFSGGNINGIIFSGGDVTVNSWMGLKGAVFAKNNLTSVYSDLSYNQLEFDKAFNGASDFLSFLSSHSSGSGGSSGGSVDISNVIVSQNIAAVGRK